VRGVYLIGTPAGTLAEAVAAAGIGVPVAQAGTLERAMAGAWDAAAPGEAVLLSPGCESFDQFADYRERGDRFLALMSALPARTTRRARV
jgi:UDP-N-acetylmuramoylalanine--D-glutamate ligase